MSEICQRCKGFGSDRRTLWMACFYEMKELGLPFEKLFIAERDFYTLRVCKSCRADWMSSIREWFNAPIIAEPEEGIPTRELGATRMKPDEVSHD